MRLPRLTVPPPLYLLLALVLGWSGMWWLGMEDFERRVERLRADLTASGFTLSSAEVRYGGFPYRYTAETRALRVEHPSGLWFATPLTRLTTLPLQEAHMVLEAGPDSAAGLGAAQVGWPEGLRLGWQPTAHGAGLDVGLSAATTRLGSGSESGGEIRGLSVEAAPAPVTAPEAAPTLRWVVRWQAASGLSLPNAWAWLGPEAGPLFAAGEVPEAHRLAQGVPLAQLGVRILGLEVVWGPLEATGAGAWRPGAGLLLTLRAARAEALSGLAPPPEGEVQLAATGPLEADGRTPVQLSWRPVVP